MDSIIYFCKHTYTTKAPDRVGFIISSIFWVVNPLFDMIDSIDQSIDQWFFW